MPTKKPTSRAEPRPASNGARPFDPDAAAQPGAGIFGLPHAPEEAAVVVIPVPFDATTSYRPGTAKGPAAVLEASHQVDLWDREYGPIHEGGIAMLPVPEDLRRRSADARELALPILEAGGAVPGDEAHAAAIRAVDDAGGIANAWVREQARRQLDAGRFACVLGGDHASPFGLIDELAERCPGMGILHVDAHADLRRAYEGFRWSHASIFWNVLSQCPGVEKLVQVGVRDFGHGELRVIEESAGRVETFFEADLRSSLARGESWDAACHRMIAPLPDLVHVSVDIDGLSPDLCPHTGTPVPGGLSFGELTHLLRTLSLSGKRIIGLDLCEVTPGPEGDEWDAAVGARVLYKLIGCAKATRRSASQG